MSKHELRKRLKIVLESISAAELSSQSNRIAIALEPLLAEYAHIGCYINMDSGEAQTDLILAKLFQLGKSVYLPRCTSTKITGQAKLYKLDRPYERHLTFHKMPSMEHVKQLTPAGKYRLREPKEVIPAPLPPAELELLLVPGVAFDISNGARLGHGAGYYDDFIHRCLYYNKKRPLLVGISLREQLITGIPLEAHDIAMDAVVCGDGTLHWRSDTFMNK